MRINTNVSALNAWRNLGATDNALGKSLEKLSSGLRINRASDDAAGLAISEKMRGQVKGLNQAIRNAQDGISLIQTAEGALNETHSILQRMRELAVQSSNDTLTDVDRDKIQAEVDELATELSRISNTTEFNTKNLLNGGLTGANIGELVFHIGANSGQNLSFGIGAMDAATLGVATAALGAEVDAGNLTGASLARPVGDSVVAGAGIDISTAANTGVEAEGALTVDGETLTATADAVGNELNGLQIVFGGDSDAAIDATYDAGTNTITVTADWDDDNNDAPADLTAIETAINAALVGANLGEIGLDESDPIDIAEFVNAGTITLAGGAEANANETIVTLDDGTTEQSVVVSNDATSVSVASGAYQGLSFTTTDITTENGTINIASVDSTAASFVDGELDAEAFVAAGIDVSTRTAADLAITTINDAINSVSEQRSNLGALQNRLEHTINNLSVASENLAAAESRIRDVDMAAEMMNFTRNQILTQAGTAMLAQANLKPQSVLQLLG